MSIAERELTLIKTIAAPRAKVFEAYINPELLKQWWAPKPWLTTDVTIDPRSGGVFNFVMQSPEGVASPYEGMLLEVVPNEKFVFSDAFTLGWIPTEDPFMVGIITFEDADGGTKITAVARHWTVEAKERHEKMGFHEGWGQAVSQLEELLK